MNKTLSRILCLIMVISLILPFSAVSFAENEESGEIQRASTLDEYIDATTPADDPDPVFGTRRIKVKAVLDSYDGAACGASYDGNTLLSFDTVEETEAAYESLCEEFGEENVIIDLPLLTPDASASALAWESWGKDFMNFDDELKRRSENPAQTVTVAVIDSGIDSSHAIFSGTQISPESKDFINTGNGIADEEGHGTSVAGIVAEVTPDNVELMILKTYTNTKPISVETVNQAIRYAADNGADVINLSMTIYVNSYIAEHPDIADDVEKGIEEMDAQLRYARDKGAIIVVSSGNDYQDIGELRAYPAVSENTIAVGSVDKQGQPSYFSNYGSALDFCAPGEDLYVAEYYSGDWHFNPAIYPDNCNGTSFSAPYIAACCAYVKMDNAAAGNQEAIEALKARCVDYGAAGWDVRCGWGMPRFPDYVDEAAREAAARAAAEARARATTSVAISGGTVNAGTINAAIAAAGGRNEYVTELVLGKGVKKISKNAFAGTKITTLVVQSKKLKKSSVKGSLKGSAVKTIKVQVGNKKTNKKYVTKYKKIFTKKNAGKKAKVKR